MKFLDMSALIQRTPIWARRFWPHALVAGFSLLALVLLPLGDIAQAIAALPLAGSLLMILVQLVRDEAAREHEQAQQGRDHTFTMAAASHMSKVVFDKHVEFCEAYREALLDLVGHMIAEGESSKAYKHLAPLHGVRRKYGLWVSPQMAELLDEFEQKVAEMAGARSVYEARDEAGVLAPGDEQLQQRAFDILCQLLGLNIGEQDADRSKSGYVRVYEHLQKILGVDRLTELRERALEDAIGSK